MHPTLDRDRIVCQPAARPERRAGKLTRSETILAGAWLALLVLAVVGPAVAQPDHYHAFADQRGLPGLPYALDVLSNLPFAAFGLLGGWMLWHLPSAAVSGVQRRLAGMFFAGLLLTAACSSWYHWHPDDARLAVDRSGMVMAFAGLLGLAAATRISERAGHWLACATLACGVLSVGVWSITGNVLPWAVLQFGGMALVLWLASRKRLDGAIDLSLSATILIYALAKVLELADAQVFQRTGEAISGHSLKHMVAAGAALPLLAALRRGR